MSTAFPLFIPIAIGMKSGNAVDISIYNLLGERVYASANCLTTSTGILTIVPIAIGSRLLSSGMYSLEIISEQKIFRGKFVKQQQIHFLSAFWLCGYSQFLPGGTFGLFLKEHWYYLRINEISLTASQPFNSRVKQRYQSIQNIMKKVGINLSLTQQNAVQLKKNQVQSCLRREQTWYLATNYTNY